jgi:hypothetical protein
MVLLLERVLLTLPRTRLLFHDGLQQHRPPIHMLPMKYYHCPLHGGPPLRELLCAGSC